MSNDRPKLAILYTHDSKPSPSNFDAIIKFCDAALENGMDVEVIGEHDQCRLHEFDALFIRDTTYRNHYTMTMARTARALNMIVLDRPNDIIDCTSKEHFHNFCATHEIKTPKTVIYRNGTYTSDADVNTVLSNYPLVIKSTDGCFSQDTYKANNVHEFNSRLQYMQCPGISIIIQEFVPTEFDWRLGFLNGKFLFACKYYMAHNDWRIIKYNENGDYVEGEHESVAFKHVPANILLTANKIIEKWGNGFYGLDLKEYNGEVYAIEINDNPSIDSGVEDYMYPYLYDDIIKYFSLRIAQGQAVQSGCFAF